jgi:hypothetical protein
VLVELIYLFNKINKYLILFPDKGCKNEGIWSCLNNATCADNGTCLCSIGYAGKTCAACKHLI